MTRRRRAPIWLSHALLALGLSCLVYVLYVVFDRQAYQVVERQRLDAARQTADALGADAPRTPLVEGHAIGAIELPRLKLSAVIVQGDSPALLRRAVGHLASTAWTDEPGNIVLAGHRDTFFRPLEDVRVGDVITLTTIDGGVDYQVESTRVVEPADVGVLRSSGGRTLTLVTCYPFSYIGPAPQRFIVSARAVVDPM
jgi:sortase A